MTQSYGPPTEEMVYLPPYFASLVLMGNAIDASNVLDMVALAVLLAGVFVVARYRAALAAADATAKAWHEERDAAVSRADRIASDLVKARADNAALQMRPDLETLTELVKGQRQDMQTMADRIVRAIEDHA